MPRGRQKGQTKKCYYVTDPALGEYKIQVDEHSFNPMLDDGENKALAYCSSMGSAIKYIVRQKLVNKQQDMELRQYIKEFKQIEANLSSVENLK